jgi:cysteine synthase A
VHQRPYESILDLIGRTPVLHLGKSSPQGSAGIYAKLELHNPGGSIKDRPALQMVLDAEAAGVLRPGATIIEPTAGNTGIGLALVGVARGYRVILVVPEGFSREKSMIMRSLGARVVHTPAATRMAGAIKEAKRLAAEIRGAFVPQQFENMSNPEGHYRTTGRELWEQMEGRIDALAIGAGSGGTFTGVARYVKERNSDAVAILVEPEGSIFSGGEPGCHRVEGIGSSFWPEVLDRSLVDEIMMISDEESYAMVRRLARQEGLLVGGSSGANVAAAMAVAQRLPAAARVITIIPDGMERYLSRGPEGDAQAASLNTVAVDTV